MNRKEYYVWLLKCLGPANKHASGILEQYTDLAEFYEDCKKRRFKRGVCLDAQEMEFLYETQLSDIDFVFERYERFHTQFVTPEDELYPQQLKNIDCPPLVLFVVGDISHLEEELPITVVGTRRESLYGRRACELICSELSVCGFSIVSGLANGGDTTAHKTALRCKGRTYGLLACGLDVDYPTGKASLKNQIYKHGAIITEFLPGIRAVPENFHIRNRLLSGLSVGTLVIEAPRRSGTLITANNAANQGRDVFAVPSGIFWKNSAGVIELIQNGAKPVRDALDIIEDYIDRYPEKIRVPENRADFRATFLANHRLGLDDENAVTAVTQPDEKEKKRLKRDLQKAGKAAVNGQEQKIVSLLAVEERLKKAGLTENAVATEMVRLLKEGSHTVDELVEKTGIEAAKILANLTRLELACIAKKSPGNRIDLIL